MTPQIRTMDQLGAIDETDPGFLVSWDDGYATVYIVTAPGCTGHDR